MAAQRQRARDAGKFAVDYNNIVKLKAKLSSTVIPTQPVKARL